MVGAKCETEIVTVSTIFFFFAYGKDEFIL